MSDTPSSHATALRTLLSRRRLLARAGAVAGTAGIVPAGIALSHQRATPEGTPGASPAASPEASPVATPTPDPIPDHRLTIIKDQRPEYAGRPVQGGTLSLYVASQDLTDFSPTAQRQDLQALISVLDPLVWIDEITMEPKPWLATGWTWSADGLALSFDLRTDVTFHNGTPFSANDVRFSILAYRDDYDSRLTSMFGLVTDVIVESPARATVTFAEPDGAFLFNAASQPIFLADQYSGHWESRPVGERTLSGFDWGTNPPIGTGPWIPAAASGSELTFRRNDTYWNGASHFDELRLIAQDDPHARIEGWKDGDVDVLAGIRHSDLEQVWDEEGTLFVTPSPTVFFAAFNFANPANATADMMADPALRQALTRAVDREAYANDVFFTFIDEEKAGTIVQPWAHDDSIRNPAFDVDEANRILDEAGWEDVDGDGMREDARGNELDLYLIVSNQERPELLAIIDGLGESFEKIGARLTVEELDPDVLDDRWVENRMYDMVAFSLVEYPAFNHFDLYGTAWDIRANTRGWNPGGYSNAEVDGAIGAYFASVTTEDMRSALTTLQQAANNDLFGLWFGFPHDLVLVRKDIQGFVPNMYIQTWNTRSWWRGEGEIEGEIVDGATPVASPVATPGTGIPVVFIDPATPED